MGYHNLKITSSTYQNDPYGHLTNQCGHLVLGLGLATVAVYLGLWWPIPLAIGTAYWLISEYLLQRSQLFMDSLEDTLFVVLGSGYPMLQTGSYKQLLLCLTIGVALTYGIWRRAIGRPAP